MNKKTSNKRKSLADVKETPNKVRKTTETIISQKIGNKSPKSTNNNNKKQIIKSKISKSQNKNKKTSKKNGKKLTKHIEKDEIDELNESNDNLNDTINSDNEIEKTDSFEGENGEAESDNEKEQSEEPVSECLGVEISYLDKTTKIQDIFQDCNIRAVDFTDPFTYKYSGRVFVCFQDKKSLEKALEKNQTEINGRKITVTLSKRTDLSVYVRGMKPQSKIEDIFQDCNIDTFQIYKHPVTMEVDDGRAFITFKDKESLMKALDKNCTQVDDYILTVEPAIKVLNRTKYRLFVKNLSDNTKLESIFTDCKIKFSEIIRKSLKNKPSGKAFVDFEDEESLQKALLKHGTEHDGRVISVLRCSCSVHVTNLNENSKLEDVFQDCIIHAIDLRKDEKSNKYSGHAVVYFKDTETLEKALRKNETEFDGNSIKVCQNPSVKLENRGYIKTTKYGKHRFVKPTKPGGKHFKKTKKSGNSGDGRPTTFVNKPPKFGNNRNAKPTKFKNSGFVKSTGESYTPASKIVTSQKQLLLEKLKNKVEKLEREMRGQIKLSNKGK